MVKDIFFFQLRGNNFKISSERLEYFLTILFPFSLFYLMSLFLLSSANLYAIPGNRSFTQLGQMHCCWSFFTLNPPEYAVLTELESVVILVLDNCSIALISSFAHRFLIIFNWFNKSCCASLVKMTVSCSLSTLLSIFRAFSF